MKLPRLVFWSLVCASAILAGCASNVASSGSDLGPGVDQKRVAAIEGAARRAGIDVHWVNYPQINTPLKTQP